MYGLRKINSNGIHNRFKWPLEVGAKVIAPDWSNVPKCGGGLHCLPEGIGNYYLLKGDLWAVIEFDEKLLVRIDDEKGKVPECTIVYLSEDKCGLGKYFDFGKFSSREAYGWAKYVGDKDIMRDRIKDSEWAYNWALDIGDRDVMIDRIKDSEWAYMWARDIGNKKVMRDRVIDSKWAYMWALSIGNEDVMINRVVDSEWAYYWIETIGNRAIMESRIVDEKYRSKLGLV